MQIKQDNAILKLTFDFALLIIEYCEKLENEKKYIIARQLLKSGTSIGANINEAQNAESKSDFIHKMKIAAKEGDETEYWLLLCKHSKKYPICEHLIDQNKTINKILAKIISTSKKRLTT
jgi:four helix bundle protein